MEREHIIWFLSGHQFSWEEGQSKVWWKIHGKGLVQPDCTSPRNRGAALARVLPPNPQGSRRVGYRQYKILYMIYRQQNNTILKSHVHAGLALNLGVSCFVSVISAFVFYSRSEAKPGACTWLLRIVNWPDSLTWMISKQRECCIAIPHGSTISCINIFLSLWRNLM